MKNVEQYNRAVAQLAAVRLAQLGAIGTAVHAGFSWDGTGVLLFLGLAFALGWLRPVTH